jgi:hypothetical protein
VTSYGNSHVVSLKQNLKVATSQQKSNFDPRRPTTYHQQTRYCLKFPTSVGRLHDATTSSTADNARREFIIGRNKYKSILMARGGCGQSRATRTKELNFPFNVCHLAVC